jgi:quinolinate synthase
LTQSAALVPQPVIEVNASEHQISGPELRRKLDVLHDAAYSDETCERFSHTIAEIRRLKRERRAVVLAHNYQRPEIFEVADFIGDSLELARKARDVADADVIVFCGVHFMAETAKILNPERTVLIPDLRAGCSLADSITAESLADRKRELLPVYPDLKVVSYVNCTAEVKAESDACCTSANAVNIIERIDSNNILFVPDQNLAAYAQTQTRKNIISWDGNCYVHQQITPEEVEKVRRGIPGIIVLAHPECRADVIALADAVLSTSAMVRYAEQSPAKNFLVVTECGLSDRLLMEIPEKHFYKACKLCRFMKMITLESTRDALVNLQYEIVMPEPIRLGAKRALEKMLELSA